MNLYICKISEFENFQDYSVLTADRQKRIQAFLRKDDKLRCLLAGLLLRYEFGEAVDLLTYNSHGKPFLPSGLPYFNISHSGDYVVLASDTGEIGVDIEKADREVGRTEQPLSETVQPLQKGTLPFNKKESIEEERSHLIDSSVLVSDKVAKQCLTLDELTWFHGQAQNKAFYYLWTGKESVMKACGKGFAMPFLNFTVLPVKEGIHNIDNQNWYLQWHDFENYIICVASKTAQKAKLCQLSYEQIIKKIY